MANKIQWVEHLRNLTEIMGIEKLAAAALT